MSDQLLIVLRVCLLALIYLVFLRVLRVVWVELRAEGATVSAKPLRPNKPTAVRRPQTGRLVVLSPSEFSGQTFLVEGDVTIGRGSECAVLIDDVHASKLHARLFACDGKWMIEDLNSTNGTKLNGVDLMAPVLIECGSQVSIGDFLLEFV